MRGFLRGWLLTIAAGSLVILMVLGGTYYLLQRPSPLAAELGIASGPTPTPRPQAAQELETRLETLTEGRGTVLRLRVSQEEINSLIARELPRIQQELEAQGAPLQVESLTLVLEPDRLLVTSQVEVFGLHPTMWVAARLSIQEGQPQVEIQEVYMGRLPLPGPMKEVLNGLVEQSLERLPLQDLPLELRQLQIEQGELVLEGIAR